MKAKTYDDWLAIGYHVIKGERSSGKDAKTGLRTFRRDQVEEREYGFDSGPVEELRGDE